MTDLVRSLKINSVDSQYVRSGRWFYPNGSPDYGETNASVKEIIKKHPSRHFTFIFNLFVWLQIINFLNCRKLNGEYNVFEGFFNLKKEFRKILCSFRLLELS